MIKKRTLIIIISVAIVVIGALVAFRSNIGGSIYNREVRSLSSVLPPELSTKYGENFTYTMDKFWSCYKDDLVSQNDMTDVMQRLRDLRSQSEIKDIDVFIFIGYVSRIYTDAMNKRHQEFVDEEQQNEQPMIINQ
ncbi:MAG: hypothetical protein KAV42_02270 [Candidatus Krumholzibacteria bacterium]|nr:hypothetical protein [Candidatus Krumholzibacteria bacterium]